MPLDIFTFGEALVEVMRVEVGQPLHQPALFTGPYPSGAPFIFAMQAARLGAQVGAAGSVGADAFGQNLLTQLQADGIDTRGVQRLHSHTTGVAFVAYNTDGSRDFVFHINSAAAGQLAPAMLDAIDFDGLKLLHLMGSTLSIHADALAMGSAALARAQAAGAKISFDPNLRPQLMPSERAREVFAPFMRAADVLIPTADELCLLTGAAHVDDAAARLIGEQPTRVIVVTQGADGCTVYSNAGKQHIAGYHVEEVDPTGAGDCFDAGFVVRWLAGDRPADAARFANACGALAVTRKGPAEGAMPLADVLAFMEQQEKRHA